MGGWVGGWVKTDDLCAFAIGGKQHALVTTCKLWCDKFRRGWGRGKRAERAVTAQLALSE